MVNFKNLAGRAKEMVDKRGGVDSLKEDAEQLRNIAKGGGSLSDKATEAAEAIKQPGGATGSSMDAPTEPQPQPVPAEPGDAPVQTGSAPQDPEAVGSDEPAEKHRGEHRGHGDDEGRHGRHKGEHRGDGRGGEGGGPA